MAVTLLTAIPALAVPAITTTKSDNTPAATKKLPGQTIDYTVLISNGAGATDATGVTLTDPTPANTTLVAGSVNASPLAFDDSYNAVGNTTLRVGNPAATTGPAATDATKVTANDVEFLGDTFEISTFDATSTQGGAVNMVTSGADRGSFSYLPPVGFTGADTFTYTIRDDGTDGVAGNADDLSSVGMVTINVSNRVWYVNNAAGAGGDGRSSSPFDALADVTGASGPDAAGDIIFLHTGAGNYTGGITLLNNQTLWGQNEALVVASMTLQAAGGDPTITSAVGSGVTLASGNTLKGFTVGDTTDFDITNTTTATVGTLTISNLVLNGTGGLFRADSGGVFNVTFDSAGTTGTGGNGVHITGATSGTFNINAGAISGVGGVDVLVSGGTATVNIAASITSSVGGSVEIASHGTNNVTFSGALNITGGTGLSLHDNTSGTIAFTNASKVINTGTAIGANLANNSGATINFTGGGLDIDTSSGTGFTATGGGTVNVTGTGNSIASISATALNVVNTTIGASGLTFQSISAGNTTASPDPVNGIVLNNTGGSGGLTVTGNSSGLGGGSVTPNAPGTAATITAPVLADLTGGTITNTSGRGIVLTTTSSVSLTRMLVRDAADSGIYGNEVTGFSLLNSWVESNGNSTVAEEAGLEFVNLNGTINVTNCTISNSFEHNINWQPTSGTATFNLSGTTVGPNPVGTGANGFHFNNTSGTVTETIVVTNSNFSGNQATGFSANVDGSSAQDIKVGSTTLQNNNIGISVTSGGNADTNLHVLNNTLLSHINFAIGMVPASTSTNASLFQALITGNVIGSGAVDSGSRDAYGIRGDIRGDVDAIVTITNNTVRNTDIEPIFVDGRLDIDADAQVGKLDITIRNNTLGVPDDNSAFPFFAVYGMRLESRDTFVVTADVAGNNATGLVLEDIRFRQRDTSTFKLERLTDGDATPNEIIATTATIEGQMAADNPGNTVDETHVAGYTETANGATRDPALPGAIFPLMFAPVESSMAMTREEPIVPPTSEKSDDMPPSATVPSPRAVATSVLSQTDLDAMIAAATARWVAMGLSEVQMRRLESVVFTVEELPYLYLGEGGGDRIRLDPDAGGNGWFIDATPESDDEFPVDATTARRLAKSADVSAGRIDLLTAILHEQGHALGLCDTYAVDARDRLMFGFLTLGERRLPQWRDVVAAHLVASDPARALASHGHHLSAPISIGTLPPGKSVTVVFRVTINGATTAAQISSQGAVSGSNFTTVNTDDTDLPGGSADPTVTLVQQPPTVSNVGRSVNEGVVLAFAAADFTSSFSDPNAADTLQKIKVLSLPIHGILKLGVVDVIINQEIVVGSIGTLNYTPAPNYYGADNFGWNGSDGTAYANVGALVNITVDPTPFHQWAFDNDLTQGVNDGLGDDPDQDNDPNIEEFAFDGDPVDGADSGKIHVSIEDDGGTSYLTLTLPIRIAAPAFSTDGNGQQTATIHGIVYLIQAAVVLTDFNTEDVVERATINTAGFPALSPGYGYRSFRMTVPIGSISTGFMRGKVSDAP